jgi:thioredoxin-like negative regulator of GroEL
MTQKEIIEFSNSTSVASQAMQPIIEEFLKENPNISYSRVNYDEDPDIVKMLISSQAPTIAPFFVSFHDGKATGSAAGIVSKDELRKIIS